MDRGCKEDVQDCAWKTLISQIESLVSRLNGILDPSVDPEREILEGDGNAEWHV